MKLSYILLSVIAVLSLMLVRSFLLESTQDVTTTVTSTYTYIVTSVRTSSTDSPTNLSALALYPISIYNNAYPSVLTVRGISYVNTIFGPAAIAGLKDGTSSINILGQKYLAGGDILLAANGTKLLNKDVLSAYIEGKTLPGQTITFLIVRGGVTVTQQVLLDSIPR